MEKQRRLMHKLALINYYGRISMSFYLGSWIPRISRKKWGRLTWSFNCTIVMKSTTRRLKRISKYSISERPFSKKWRRKNQSKKILKRRANSPRKSRRRKWRNRRRRRQRRKMLSSVSQFFNQRKKFYWTTMEFQHAHSSNSSNQQWEAQGTKSQSSLATPSKTSSPKT